MSGYPVVVVHDPHPGSPRVEPVEFTVPGVLEEPCWSARTGSGEIVPCQVLRQGSTSAATRLVTVLTLDGDTTVQLVGPSTEPPAAIRELSGMEADCVVRLDTGVFDLELCRGTGQGTGASKWGLRHFSATADRVDLLPSGNNAIGGFYGPFFTPENGLINPPEHTVADVEVLERGPLRHSYRLSGTVPDGLLPELRGKRFSVDWEFTAGCSWFGRVYRVDEFSTVVNGRSVTNKITVGDEFESGPGSVVFDRFAAAGGTRYRSGDPYAGQLAEMVAETVRTSTADTETFRRFREALTGDIEAAHWDLYWRLFCAWEAALPEAEIRDRLARVRAASHVLADLPDRVWRLDEDPVDVSAVPHETVFAGPADRTAEFHTGTGRAMVWWTSAPSGAFQIVQRPQSGWVNWGTNGENECPELPVGVQIRTAYGPFADRWAEIAEQLAHRPVIRS